MMLKGGFSHIGDIKLYKTKSAFSRVVGCCLPNPQGILRARKPELTIKSEKLKQRKQNKE